MSRIRKTGIVKRFIFNNYNIFLFNKKRLNPSKNHLIKAYICMKTLNER